jgi:hypothetical protein
MKKIYLLSSLLAVCSCLSAQVKYAETVINFSSEFSNPSWSAAQTIGEPDTYPNYGDITTAWASQTADGQREFIELSYASNTSPVDSIFIFETYNAGAVDLVQVKGASGSWQTVYSATAQSFPNQSRIMRIGFSRTSFAVKAVRIELNSPAIASWNEIDAVGISDGSALVLSAEEPELAGQIKLYPNPTQNLVKLDLGELKGQVHIELLNLAGQVVWQQKREASLSIAEIILPAQAGVYELVVSTRKEKASFKVLKL